MDIATIMILLVALGFVATLTYSVFEITSQRE